jgi:predicted component of type VI protein secretion system
MIQGSESFRLVVRRGPQPNQTYELNKDINTLGRDITNDIVINDPEVSRHHMRMTRGAGGYTVEDLGSTNGTFINGQRLTGARPLRNGDMIGLGETVTLGYEVIAGAAPADAGGMQTVPGQQRPASPGVGVAPMQPGGVQPGMPAQPGQAPYQPGQQYQPQQQPGPSVQPQQGGQYGGGYYQPQSSGYGASPSPSPAPPQAPPIDQGGYAEYDPYGVRDEEPRNTTRWVLIGCAGLSLFCCCSSVLGLVAVDQLCLWDRIPLVYDILRAFGYTMVC